jgi:hypothetical protein
MEKHTSYLPAPAAAPRPSPRSRIVPVAVLAALTFLAINVLPNGNPISNLKDTTRALHSHLQWSDEFYLPAYTQEYLEAHVKCPVQPKALFPKMKWNMTKADKVSSLDKFSQSVVCPGFTGIMLM